VFFILAVTNITSYAVLWVLFALAGSKISKKYHVRYLSYLLSKHMAFFEVVRNSSGALPTILSTDGDDLEMLFNMSIALMMVFAIDILACGILGIAIGWRLGLAGVFGCFPVLFLTGYFRLRMDATAQDRFASAFLESAGYASEAAESIKTV
jgi:ATP-binding cassette subfamily B (MDR/TAP) protein 1